jgi:hypothetical protein
VFLVTVILDGNLMHISFIYIHISERHKSNILQRAIVSADIGMTMSIDEINEYTGIKFVYI